MKKFQFSLDSVLSYKQQVLEGIQNEYAALTAKVRQQEERVRAAWQRYADLNQEFREKEAFGMTIVEAR
ncbi:MAG TPA: flagellar export protein FliJ, partial [Candidatus Caccousia avicola]|nr:flagellar export protein FliJ [Candidatus Caccousia avicola]